MRLQYIRIKYYITIRMDQFVYLQMHQVKMQDVVKELKRKFHRRLGKCKKENTKIDWYDKDEIKNYIYAKNKTQVVCECGKIIFYSSRVKHRKSKQHIKEMEFMHAIEGGYIAESDI